METVKCEHQAAPRSLALAADINECALCHQQVRYSLDKLRPTHHTVTRLGRIGDKIVLPDPTHKLQLNLQDLTDLRAAGGVKDAEEKPEKQAAPSPEMRPPGQRARHKWYRTYRKTLIHDLLTLGEEGFLEKWGPFGATRHLFSKMKDDRYYLNLKEKLAELGVQGNAPAPSPEMRPKDAKARVEWYRKFKKAMIDDLIALGEAGFLEKWDKFGVTSRVIAHLKTVPYYTSHVGKSPPSPAADKNPPRNKPGPKPRSGGRPALGIDDLASSLRAGILPPLPPWSDIWATPVQLKWLEVYEKLAGQGG